jgi:hypothetical protein
VVEVQGKLVRTGTPAPAPFFRLEFFGRADQIAALAFTEYYTPRPARLPMQIDPSALALVEPGPLGMVPRSTGAATLEYAPGTDTLWRGSEFVSVPPGMASRLEARESLAAVAHGGSFPWLAVLGGVGGAALMVPTALLVRRRRT